MAGESRPLRPGEMIPTQKVADAVFMSESSEPPTLFSGSVPTTATEAVMRESSPIPTPPPIPVPTIEVGDEVTAIGESHGWGQVKSGDRGVVCKVHSNGELIDVDFPNQRGWTGIRRCFTDVTRLHPIPGDIITQIKDVKEGEDPQVEVISVDQHIIVHRHLNKKETNNASTESFDFSVIKSVKEKKVQFGFGLGDRVGIIKDVSIHGIIEKINIKEEIISIRTNNNKISRYKKDKLKVIEKRRDDDLLSPEPDDTVMLRIGSEHAYQSIESGIIFRRNRIIYFVVTFKSNYQNSYRSNELDIIEQHPNNRLRRRRTKQVIEIKEESNIKNSDILHLDRKVYKQVHRGPSSERAEVWLLGGHDNKADYILPLKADGGCCSAPLIREGVVASAAHLMMATGRFLLGFVCIRYGQIHIVEDINRAGAMEANLLSWRIQYPNCYVISVGKPNSNSIRNVLAYQLRTPITPIKLRIGNIVEHTATSTVHTMRKIGREITKKRG